MSVLICILTIDRASSIANGDIMGCVFVRFTVEWHGAMDTKDEVSILAETSSCFP